MSDDLLGRLRERAADPEGRVDARRDASVASVRAMDLGTLGRQVGILCGDLARLVEANRAGRVDPGLNATAERLGAAMSRRTFARLPPRADAAAIARAEAGLGFGLPAFLRRAYVEIANGGFGPGYGLLSLEDAVATYRRLRTESPGPDGCEWPDGLLPVVDEDGDLVCVDRAGTVVAYDAEALLEEWDPEAPDEAAARRGWRRCFSEIPPGVEAWLETWLSSPTRTERMAARMADARARAVAEARARMKAMTPERRRELGLPDIDWDRAFGDEPGSGDPEK